MILVFPHQSSSAASADKKKVKVELVLEQGHHVWLQKCTEEFSLPSVGNRHIDYIYVCVRLCVSVYEC